MDIVLSGESMVPAMVKIGGIMLYLALIIAIVLLFDGSDK